MPTVAGARPVLGDQPTVVDSMLARMRPHEVEVKKALLHDDPAGVPYGSRVVDGLFGS